MSETMYVDSSLDNAAVDLWRELDKHENTNYPIKEEFKNKRVEFIAEFIDSERGEIIKKGLDIFFKPQDFEYLTEVLDPKSINPSTIMELIANFYYGLTLGSENKRQEHLVVYERVRPQSVTNYEFNTASLDVDKHNRITQFLLCVEGVKLFAQRYGIDIYDTAFFFGLHEGDHVQYLERRGNLHGYPQDSEYYTASDREFLALAKQYAFSFYYWGEHSPQTKAAADLYVESLNLRRQLKQKI